MEFIYQKINRIISKNIIQVKYCKKYEKRRKKENIEESKRKKNAKKKKEQIR